MGKQQFEARYRKALQSHGYEYVGVIGRGGMSRVDEVRHVRSGRLYAIKHLGTHTEETKRDRYRRTLKREADYQFDHPNVMRVLDWFEAEKNVFLVMPRLQANLKMFIDSEEEQPLNILLDIIMQTSAGLIYLHQQGVVHRDMKPSNVLYNLNDSEVQVVLCDFGLSLDSWAQLARVVKRAVRAHVNKAGTPTYASPEQMRRGGRCDRRSDIYSVGRIMDDLFCQSSDDLEFMKTEQQKRRLRHLEKGIYLYKREGASILGANMMNRLPYELQKLVLECLQKDPERRPQDASAIYYAISKLLTRHRRQLLPTLSI